jgi:hypothetical protein
LGEARQAKNGCALKNAVISMCYEIVMRRLPRPMTSPAWHLAPLDE